jgi:hypothetical protein
MQQVLLLAVLPMLLRAVLLLHVLCGFGHLAGSYPLQ